MSTRRVLVIAAGDKADSNHAISELLARVREMPIARRWWLTLIGDSQFQVEHALDLQLNDLAVFIDSGAANGETGTSSQAVSTGHGVESFTFRKLERPSGHRISSMDSPLKPSDVLHTLSTIGRRESLPSCFILSVNDLSLTNSVSENDDATREEVLEGASAFLDQLLSDPEPERWESMVTA